MVVVVTGMPLPVVHTGVPAAAGPVVPDLLVNDPVKDPVAVTLRILTLVQLIGMSMSSKVTIDCAGSESRSTSEARALGVTPSPFRVRTSPRDSLLHRGITVPTPVPDTGVVL